MVKLVGDYDHGLWSPASGDGGVATMSVSRVGDILVS